MQLQVSRPKVLAAFGTTNLDRAIRAIVLVLVVGIPLVALTYWADRHVDHQPSVAERNISAAEARVRQSPDDVSARVALAADYVSAGRYEDGITQFTEALKGDTSNRAALLGRGIAYVAVAKYDLATVDFQKIVSDATAGEFAATDPQLEQAYYELGVVAIKQGQPAAALDPLRSALKIDSSDADALYSLGTALVQTGSPATGLLALRQAVAFVPSGWCDPYQGLVDAYKALGATEGIAWSTGMVDFCAGRLTAARTELTALTNGPLKVDALLGLALVAAQEGDLAGATGFYQQVLAIDPSNTSALIGLGQIGGGAHAATPAASPAGSN
jgi:Tfp pilus assembly protein PilF